MSFFYTAPLYLVVPISLIVAIGLAIAGVAFLQKRVNRDELRESQEVAAAIYAVIGTIYAVILAFVVVVVWEQFNDADKIVHEEASHLGNLRQMAHAFPETIRKEIDDRTTDYIESVMTREWPTMVYGREDSQTVVKLHNIWRAYDGFRPAASELPYYSESIHVLGEFNNARRMRILSSREKISPFMWWMLIAGAVIVIAFVYLFSTPKKWNQYVITAGLAAIITVTLLLIVELDHPFSGAVSVSTDAFQYVLDHARIDSN